jgi:hypothetical protein
VTVQEISLLALVSIVWTAVLSHRAYKLLEKEQD